MIAKLRTAVETYKANREHEKAVRNYHRLARHLARMTSRPESLLPSNHEMVMDAIAMVKAARLAATI